MMGRGEGGGDVVDGGEACCFFCGQAVCQAGGERERVLLTQPGQPVHVLAKGAASNCSPRLLISELWPLVRTRQTTGKRGVGDGSCICRRLEITFFHGLCSLPNGLQRALKTFKPSG